MNKEKFVARFFLLLILIAFVIAMFACSPGVYWHETRHDGLQKVSYKRAGWPQDQTCQFAPGTPVKRSTWSSQFYYRRKK